MTERVEDEARGGNGVRLGQMGKTKAAQAGRPAETTLVGGKNRMIQQRAPQKGGWNKARRKAFLTALASTCNVRASAAAAGMSISSAYLQRARDPGFAAAWVDALALGYDRLHDALLRMALRGVEALVVEGDEAVDPATLPEPVLTTPDSVRLALGLLEKHRATVTGAARKPGTIVRATPAETDAALRKLLDAFARRQRAAAGKAVATQAAMGKVADGKAGGALPAPAGAAEPRE